VVAQALYLQRRDSSRPSVGISADAAGESARATLQVASGTARRTH
jgi:hypothetical protein